MGDELLARVIPQDFIADELGVFGVFIQREVSFVRAVAVAVIAEFLQQWEDALIVGVLTAFSGGQQGGNRERCEDEATKHEKEEWGYLGYARNVAGISAKPTAHCA